MLFHPVFSVYDMDDSQPSWRSSQLRRQQEQQEQAYYNELARQQEQPSHQQAYYNELARRQRLQQQVEMEREQQYRRKIEEEMRRRQQEAVLHRFQHHQRQQQAAEEAYRHRQQMKERSGQPYQQPSTSHEKPTTSTTTSTTGRNDSAQSRSYRIPVTVVHQDNVAKPHFSQDAEKVVQSSDTKPTVRDATSTERVIPIETKQPSNVGTASLPTKEEKKNTTKRAKRQPVAVLVEDASDSENEDEDLKSVWRNRRPSPGQWLEPIEFY